MQRELKDIVSIKTGLYKKQDPMGDILYLQGKHFDRYGNLDQDAIIGRDVRLDPSVEKHLLKDKDLLFIAKGDNNRVCLYSREIGPAVASSLFFVLRLKTREVLPEFLQWYINLNPTRRKLQQMARGSHIPSVSKSTLKSLSIPVPEISIQKNVIAIWSLVRSEIKITEVLMKEKETYYQYLLMELIHKKRL